jgi:hypothetical protein
VLFVGAGAGEVVVEDQESEGKEEDVYEVEPWIAYVSRRRWKRVL